MAKLFTYNGRLRVSLRKEASRYYGDEWEIVLEAERIVNSETEISRHIYSRAQAQRLHRNLGVMLRATAPAKKKS